jgi:hypothetical protein
MGHNPLDVARIASMIQQDRKSVSYEVKKKRGNRIKIMRLVTDGERQTE